LFCYILNSILGNKYADYSRFYLCTTTFPRFHPIPVFIRCILHTKALLPAFPHVISGLFFSLNPSFLALNRRFAALFQLEWLVWRALSFD
jgi:hypothetical protein